MRKEESQALPASLITFNFSAEAKAEEEVGVICKACSAVHKLIRRRKTN